MKRLFAITIFLILNSSSVWALNPVEPATESGTIELYECEDEKMGISLLCNPDWEIKTEDDVILIVISEEPYVSMTVAKSKSPVISLQQLTNRVLTELGSYKPNFRTQMIQIDGYDAIEVVAESQENETLGLVDFYLIKDVTLYSILIAIDPKDDFYKFEKLFLKIIDNFQFIKSKDENADNL